MNTTAIRQGQTEIGVVEHEGKSFAAFGGCTRGRSVTGYTRIDKRGNISLTRWSGPTMLACRSEIVDEYRHDWHSPCAIVFSLTHGRFIVGYALESDGGLFRGELIDADSPDEAARAARSESEYWMDRDWEDEQMSQYDQDEDSDDDESDDD